MSPSLSRHWSVVFWDLVLIQKHTEDTILKKKTGNILSFWDLTTSGVIDHFGGGKSVKKPYLVLFIY